MFALRPSSRFGFPEPRPSQQPDVEADGLQIEPREPFIDEGSNIPETYDLDIIRAMLQDPFRIFVYWEVREESIRALTNYFTPEEVASFRVTLKLFEVGGRNRAYFDAEKRGRYWITVFPDRDYEFEIGVRSPEHGYIALVRSNRVHTPRASVSPLTAEEPEYRMAPPQFVDVVDASGFGARKTVELTAAAMPEANLPDADFTETGVRDALSLLLANLPEPVRLAVLLAARGGALTREVIDALPEPLRSALLHLLLTNGAALAAAALMHYLPEMLRGVVEGESWLISPPTPFHVVPRFFTAGSENVVRPGKESLLPVRPSSPGIVWRN